MDGLATTQLKGIVAPINFTAPLSEKPYSYNYDPPPGVPMRNTDWVSDSYCAMSSPSSCRIDFSRRTDPVRYRCGDKIVQNRSGERLSNVSNGSTSML